MDCNLDSGTIECLRPGSFDLHAPCVAQSVGDGETTECVLGSDEGHRLDIMDQRAEPSGCREENPFDALVLPSLHDSIPEPSTQIHQILF